MKKMKIFCLIFVIGFLFGACEYNFIVPEEVPPIDNGGGNGEETVSFSTQVLPIFSTNCASCHKTGGTKPDLTAANAYQSIYTSKYINVSSPEQSKIYSFVKNGASTHKHKQYTVAEGQLMLTWITEGAKNN